MGCHYCGVYVCKHTYYLGQTAWAVLIVVYLLEACSIVIIILAQKMKQQLLYAGTWI